MNREENKELVCDALWNTETTQDYWEALRNQAAIAAMQGILSNEDMIHSAIRSVDETMTSKVVVARIAITYADALVEELRKKA